MASRPGPGLTAITNRDDSLILDRLYEAAADDDDWVVFLDDLSKLFSCPGGQFLCYDNLGKRLVSSFFSSGIAREMHERYAEVWLTRDPRLRPDRDSHPMQWNHLQADAHGGATMADCFYHGFLSPAGISHMITLRADGDDGVLAMLTLFHGIGQTPLGVVESACLERLRPHLLRAMRLHIRYRQSQRQTMLLTQALDSLDYPVMIAEPSGRLVYRNREAEGWLAKSPYFLLREGQLTARDMDMQCRFKIALREQRRVLLPLRCPNGGWAQQLVILPMSAGREPSVSLVVAVDPGAQLCLSMEDVQLLFGLTNASARVALGLSEGRSLSEIARDNQVSVNTIRTQVKQIMDRTGARRQADLVRLVRALPRLRWP